MVDAIGWTYITFIMWHVWHGLEITMNARNVTKKEAAFYHITIIENVQ